MVSQRNGQIYNGLIYIRWVHNEPDTFTTDNGQIYNGLFHNGMDMFTTTTDILYNGWVYNETGRFKTNNGQICNGWFHNGTDRCKRGDCRQYLEVKREGVEPKEGEVKGQDHEHDTEGRELVGSVPGPEALHEGRRGRLAGAGRPLCGGLHQRFELLGGAFENASVAHHEATIRHHPRLPEGLEGSKEEEGKKRKEGT